MPGMGRIDGLQGHTAESADWVRLVQERSGACGPLSLYAPLLTTPVSSEGCFVLGRIAQSLDGRIATLSGASFWISGPEDILHTHRLRALFDVVLVGAGTVRADDPLLTTRACSGPSPVRVVLDPNFRLGVEHKVFNDGRRTLIFVAEDQAAPDRHGCAEVLRVPRALAGLDLASVLQTLAQRGLKRVFVEGGGLTVSRFLAAGLLERLHVTLAPLLLGGGIPSFTLPDALRPQDGMALEWIVHHLGRDLLFDIPINRARPPACQ